MADSISISEQFSQREATSPAAYQPDVDRSSLAAIRAMTPSGEMSDVLPSLSIEGDNTLIAGLPASGDNADLQPRPQWYSIGHQEPGGRGDKIVVTGPTEDMPTGWNQIMAGLSRTGGWDATSGNNLSQMIDNVIAEYQRDGNQFKQVVIRSHGYGGALSINGQDYELSSPQVQAQFARLRTSGALAPNAQIELQGCNVASGADQRYSSNRDGLQTLANVTGASVEASAQMQRANRFGWTGQVVRFSPQR